MDINKKEEWEKKIMTSGMTAAEYLDTLAVVYDTIKNREMLVSNKKLELVENQASEVTHMFEKLDVLNQRLIAHASY